MVYASGPDHEVTSGGEIRIQCAVCLRTIVTNSGTRRKVKLVQREMFWPGKELAAAAAQGKGGCAGWDLRIDRAIFVRPSLTEPPEILNLLLLPFSPFSSTFSSSSFSSSSSGRGKNGGECVVLSTPAPRPPPPNRKPLFFADIAAVRVGQAANRPIGANFFLPHPPTHLPA